MQAPDLEQDTDLMVRFCGGDSACLEALVTRHRPGVIHYFRRVVGEQAVAEELAQEVFLRVVRSRATYQPQAKFTTWIYRIAANLALNWLRDHRRERNSRADAGESGKNPLEIKDPAASAFELVARDQELTKLRGAVQSALSRLPDRQREAVRMRAYDDLCYADIAEALDCSTDAVKSLLFRAYTSLRVCLS